MTWRGKSVQCCTCSNWVHLKCSLLFSKFRTLGRSHSWSFPPCFFGDPTSTSTVTSSSDFSSIWYTSTAQSGPLLLMHHPHPTLSFKPLIPFLPTLFLRPLHPHHRLMILAVSLYLLALLSTPSGLFNGMLGVSEPGALNCYTFFRLIPMTLFVSRNPKAVNRITSLSATCYYKIPLLFTLHTRNTATYKKSIY